jgi:hypothetical protein
MGETLARVCLAAFVAVMVALAPVRASADQGAFDGRDRVVVTVADPRITESSGLAFVSGAIATVNDSGHAAVVYSIDPATGRVFRATRFASVQTDVEALAPAGPTSVWVGDIGNNDGSRKTLSVTKVSLDGTGDPSSAATYSLRYPRGVHLDAEALLSEPHTGRLYVVSKRVTGGTVFALPEELDANSPNQLTPLGDVGPLVTDGAFLPGGDFIVLRGYARATVYTFPGLSAVGSFALPHQRQGEGLALQNARTLLLSSEGPKQAILRVTIPRSIVTAMQHHQPSIEPATSPSAGPTDALPQAPAGAVGDGDHAGVSPLAAGLGVAAVVAAAVGGLVIVRRRRTPR